MMDAITAIFRPYLEGQPAVFASGRSPYDLVLDGGGTIRPLLEALRRVCREDHGMALITYSLAGGLDWGGSRIKDERDRRVIEQALRAHHLLDIPQDQHEVARIFRGISSLARTPTDGLKWSDGKNLRFMFVIEFSEHLVPGTLTNGTQTDAQLVAIELAHITAQSLALRSSKNFIVFHGREGLVDDLVCGALGRVRLPQPAEEEKRAFLDAALSLYTDAAFEDGLSPEAVAHLTVNTPNRGLETLLRASHLGGHKLTARELSGQKNQDVEELSER